MYQMQIFWEYQIPTPGLAFSRRFYFLLGWGSFTRTRAWTDRIETCSMFYIAQYSTSETNLHLDWELSLKTLLYAPNEKVKQVAWPKHQQEPMLENIWPEVKPGLDPGEWWKN